MDFLFGLVSLNSINYTEIDKYPKWKREICLKNHKLYIENKNFIDEWLKKWNNLEAFTNTEKKFLSKQGQI